MISKVTNYAGFNSYSTQPYASLKPGKTDIDSNQIWSKTKRANDKQSLYDNHQGQRTVYQEKHLNTISPADFENPVIYDKKYGFIHKKRNQNKDIENLFRTQYSSDPQISNNTQSANQTSLGFVDENKKKTCMDEQMKLKERQLLQTGSEHWCSMYTNSFDDPGKQERVKQPEWSKHKPPYVVRNPMGPTEYEFYYGVNGSKPTDIMNPESTQNPRLTDPLKMGTTQLSNHIPGYTGFIPHIKTATKAYEHGLGLNTRTTFQKENIVENYHIKLPGYAGFKPQSALNVDDSCVTELKLVKD